MLGPARLYTQRGDETYQELHTDYPVSEKGALITDFLNAVSLGMTNPTPEAEIFEALAVGFAIEESLQSGGRPAQVRPFLASPQTSPAIYRQAS